MALIPLPDLVVNQLIYSLNDDEARNNCASLLRQHIDLAKKPLSMTMTDNIAKVVLNEEAVFEVTQVLTTIHAHDARPFSDYVLDCLSLALQPEHLANRLDLLALLKKSLQKDVLLTEAFFQRIEQLLYSDEQEQTENVLVVLWKGLRKKPKAYIHFLSSSCCITFSGLAKNISLKLAARKAALKMMALYAKYSKKQLDFDAVFELKALLHHENTVIQKNCIHVLFYQIHYFLDKDYPNKEMTCELIATIESLIEDATLTEDVLNLLQKALEFHYSIKNETLKAIAFMIWEQKNNKIRSSAKEILLHPNLNIKANRDAFPEIFAAIDLERNIPFLCFEKPAFEARRNAYLSCVELINKGFELTINNHYTLAEIFQKPNLSLITIIDLLLTSVSCHHSLPVHLLSSLCQFVQSQVQTKRQSDQVTKIGEILALTVLNGTAVTLDFYNIFEILLQNFYIHEFILQALEKGFINQFQPQLATLALLIQLLRYENEAIQSSAAKMIYQLSVNGQELIQQELFDKFSLLVDEAIQLPNEKGKAYLMLTLQQCYQSGFILLTQAHLVKLSQLISSQSKKLEKPILEIFDNYLSDDELIKKIGQDGFNRLKLKRLEREFINATTTKQRKMVLFNEIVEPVTFLSQSTWEAIAVFLESLTNDELLNALLKIGHVQKQQSLAIELHPLLIKCLFNSMLYSHAGEILAQVNDLQQEWIEQLFMELEQQPSRKIRAQIGRVLVKQQQSNEQFLVTDAQLQILELEQLASNKDINQVTFNQFWQKIQQGYLITKAAIYLLKCYIKANVELDQACFSYLVEHVPNHHMLDLFWIAVMRMGHEYHLNHEVLKLALSLLDKISFDATTSIKLVVQLENFVKNSPLNFCHAKLLLKVMQQCSKYGDSSFIETLLAQLPYVQSQHHALWLDLLQLYLFKSATLTYNVAHNFLYALHFIRPQLLPFSFLNSASIYAFVEKNVNPLMQVNQTALVKQFDELISLRFIQLLAFVYRKMPQLFEDAGSFFEHLKRLYLQKQGLQKQVKRFAWIPLWTTTVTDYNPLEQLPFLARCELLLTEQAYDFSKVDFEKQSFELLSEKVLYEKFIVGIKEAGFGIKNKKTLLKNGELINDYLEKLKKKVAFGNSAFHYHNLLEVLYWRQQRYQLNDDQILQELIVLSECEQNPIHIVVFANETLLSGWLTYVYRAIPAGTIENAVAIEQMVKCTEALKFSFKKLVHFVHQIIKVNNRQAIAEFLNFANDIRSEGYDIDAILLARYEVADPLNAMCFKIYYHVLITDIIEICNYINQNCDFRKQYTVCSLDYLESALWQRVAQLLTLKWNFSALKAFFARLKIHIEVNPMYPLLELLYAFDLVLDYQFTEDFFYQVEDLEQPENFVKALHEQAIAKNFSFNAEDLKTEELFNQLFEMNRDDKAFVKQFEFLKKRILTILNEAQQVTFSKIHPQFNNQDLPAIKEWSTYLISDWTVKTKSILRVAAALEQILPEIIVVLERALTHYATQSGEKIHKPRINQWIAVLALLLTQNKGRLIQVATGEGKSIIIALFAVIKALSGETVDIVTSSPLLAHRDAEQFEKFYVLFGLKVASNQDKDYVKGLKKCYNEDVQIIYSDVSTFQFDVLRHEFYELGTRGKRDFGTIIVDEVDNLLIDEANKIAMLASAMPGMEHLTTILIAIWNELQRLHRALVCQGDRYYFTEVVPGTKQYESIEVTDPNEFLLIHLLEYVKNIIDPKSPMSLILPNHLQPFVERQLPKWVEHAVSAMFQYKEKKHYVFGADEHGDIIIEPVDYDNTGVTQVGTTWGDGLHQFLQIKHGLRVTPETLVTNFISNMAYINRYGTNIYGLSGTLGSKRELKLMSQMYSIDFVRIPSHKAKQLKELPIRIEESEEHWYYEVAIRASREAKAQRVVLVLTETIEEADFIYERLHLSYQGHVKIYKDSKDVKNAFIGHELDPNTIIIATNLAARGADFKLSKISLDCGGLEVIDTFLPKNSRVEQQTFGRTCRRGEPGTARFILKSNALENRLVYVKESLPKSLTQATIEVIRAKRDECEILFLDQFQEFELQQMQNKDFLFQQFSELLKTLAKSEYKINPYERKAIEEHWAFWLKEQNFLGEKKAWEKAFKTFADNIQQQVKEKKVIHNPSYYLMQGNDLLAIANTFKRKATTVLNNIKDGNILSPKGSEKLNEAITAYKAALHLDPIFAYMAHYNIVYASVKYKANDKDIFKADMQGHLSQVKEIIEEKLFPQMQAIVTLLQMQLQCADSHYQTALYQQVNRQIKLLQRIDDSIVRAVRNLKVARRQMDVRKDQEDYQTELTTTQACEIINKDSSKKYSVRFHDLKTYSNIGKSSQSANTIYNTAIDGHAAILFQEEINLSEEIQRKELLLKIPAYYYMIEKEQAVTKENNNQAPTATQNQSDHKSITNARRPFAMPQVEEALPSMEKKLVGVAEHTSYAAEKVGSGMRFVWDKGKKIVGKASEKMGPMVNRFQAWKDNADKLKLIPVSLTLKQVTAAQVIKILEKVNANKIMIEMISPDFLKGFATHLAMFNLSKFQVLYETDNQDKKYQQQPLVGSSKFQVGKRLPIALLKAELPNTQTKIELEEHEVKPDGDCGFTTLGTDRATLSQTLLLLKTDAKAREFLAEEIATAFTTYLVTVDTPEEEGLKPDDPVVWKKLLDGRDQAQKQLDALFQKVRHGLTDAVAKTLPLDQLIVWLQQQARSNHANEAKALIDQRLSVFQAESAIQHHCQTQAVYDYYVRALGNASSDKPLWLGYKSAILFARQKKIYLYIWRKDIPNNPSQLVLVEYFQGDDNSANEIHMLHTHGFTHFNLLSKLLASKNEQPLSKPLETQKSPLDAFLQQDLQNIRHCQLNLSLLEQTELQSVIKKMVALQEKGQIFEGVPLFINLEFNSITQDQAIDVIQFKFGVATIHYPSLSKEDARILALFLDSSMNAAILEMSALKASDADELIKNADLTQQDLKIDFQAFEPVLRRMEWRPAEIMEYYFQGYLYLYELNEHQPRPILESVLVGVLGMAQIAIGLALVTGTAGFGASLGMSLMSEGIGDIIRALTAIYNRDLNFSDYAKQKAISLVIALGSAGWSSYRSAAKVAKSTIQVGQEAAKALLFTEQSMMQATEMLSTTATRLTVFQSATKHLIGASIRNSIAQSTEKSLQKVKEFTLEKIKPTLEEFVRNKVQELCEEGIWRRQFNYLFAMDKIFSSSKNKDNLIREAKRIIDTQNVSILGYNAINPEIFNEFYAKFNKIINENITQQPSFPEMLLRKFPDLTKDTCHDIYKFLLKNNFIINDNFESEFVKTQLDLISGKLDVVLVQAWQPYEKMKPQLLSFFKDCHNAFSENYTQVRREFKLQIMESFNQQLSSSIQTALEIMNKGVSYGVNQLGEKAAKLAKKKFAQAVEQNSTKEITTTTTKQEPTAADQKTETSDSKQEQHPLKEATSSGIKDTSVTQTVSESIEGGTTENSQLSNNTSENQLATGTTQPEATIIQEPSLAQRGQVQAVFQETKQHLLQGYESKLNQEIRAHRARLSHGRKSPGELTKTEKVIIISDSNQGIASSQQSIHSQLTDRMNVQGHPQIQPALNTNVSPELRSTSVHVNQQTVAMVTSTTTQVQQPSQAKISSQQFFEQKVKQEKLLKGKAKKVKKTVLDRYTKLQSTCKAAIPMAITVLKEILVKKHEQELKNSLAETRFSLLAFYDSTKEIQLVTGELVKQELSKQLKLLLGIAIFGLKLEQKISQFEFKLKLNLDYKISEEMNIKLNNLNEEVEEQVDKIFTLCMLQLNVADIILIKELKLISPYLKSIDETIYMLRCKFEEYKQLNGDLHMLRLQTDTKKESTSEILSTVNSGIKHGSNAVTAISNAITEYQKTKTAAIEAKAKTAKELMGSINALGLQVQNLVKGQNEVITKSTTQFMDICKKLEEVTPHKIEEIKAKRLEFHKKQADTLLNMFEKNPDNIKIMEMYDKRAEEFNKASNDADVEVNKSVEGLRDSIKTSQQEFRKLMESLKLSDNQVIMKAIDLQEKMVEFAKQILDIKPEKEIRPTSKSSVTAEEVTEDGLIKATGQLQIEARSTPNGDIKQSTLLGSQGIFPKVLAEKDLELIKGTEKLILDASSSNDIDVKDSCEKLKQLIKQCRDNGEVSKQAREIIEKLIKIIEKYASVSFSPENRK